MPRKYYTKTAIASYTTILIAVATFGVSFVYEGWGDMGVAPMLTPLGRGSCVLFLSAIVLFIWNLRREELTHEQWLELRDKRQADLARLRDAVNEYVRATFRCMKNPVLYRLNEGYQYHSKPSALSLFKDIGVDNACYARIVNDELADARMDLDNITGRLYNKRIRRMIRQLWRRAHIARSYQIFLRIYRAQYSPTPAVEKCILRREPLSALAEYVSKIHAYVAIMERGKDFD